MAVVVATGITADCSREVANAGGRVTSMMDR
jgi:hypothetical protein